MNIFRICNFYKKEFIESNLKLQNQRFTPHTIENFPITKIHKLDSKICFLQIMSSNTTNDISIDGNKQNLQFILPSLINTQHSFEQLFYHQNKYIVYGNDDNKRDRLISSKVSSLSKPSIMLQRPNTSVSINRRFSPQNQFIKTRNQASIDNFVLRHKKINDQKYKTQVNWLTKRKVDPKWMKKHRKLNENDTKTKTNVELNQNKTNEEIIKIKTETQSKLTQVQSLRKQIIHPEDKLINQIIEKKSIIPVNKDFLESLKSVKSIQRLQTKRQEIAQRNNTLIQLSVSKQKVLLELNANHYYLRKQDSMIQRQENKLMKISLIKSNVAVEGIRRENNQPQIKKQTNQTKIKEEKKVREIEQRQAKEQNQEKDECFFRKILDPIYIQRLPIDFYGNHQKEISLGDTQFKPILKNPSLKVNGLGNQMSHEIIKHKNRIPQIKDSIKEKQQQNFNDKPTNTPFKQEDLHQKHEQIKNQSLQLFQQSSSLINLQPYQNFNQNLNTLSSRNLSQMKSPCRLSQMKKMVNHCRLRKKNKLNKLQENKFKRANLVDCLNGEFYSGLKDQYCTMTKQQGNGFIDFPPYSQQKATEESIVSLKNCQGLQDQKDSSKHRNTQLQQSFHETNFQKERIYVDNQFPHQAIIFPQNIANQIRWLYFRPCQQSLLFPKELKLPQHYVMTEDQSQFPLIQILNCLLTINPYLIERIFEPVYNNVFSVWLFKNNLFQPVYVDGYLPYDAKLNSLFAWSQQFLWIGVLLKAAAKMFGSYDAIKRMNLDDWTKIILGFSLPKLQLPSYHQVKNWQEDEFQQKIKEYFTKSQQKHKSHIIVKQKSTNSLFIFNSIDNNKIKIIQCIPSMKRHQISLFQVLIDNNYEFFLVSESKQLYHTTVEFESQDEGNIVSFQIKVQDNTSLILTTQINEKLCAAESFSRQKGSEKHRIRRIQIYEIPFSSKRYRQKQMILKYVSEDPNTIISKDLNGIQSFQVNLPELKRGQYKVFIECGQMQYNGYLEAHPSDRRSKKENSMNENDNSKPRDNEKAKRNYRNSIAIASSKIVLLNIEKSQKRLMNNEKIQESEF